MSLTLKLNNIHGEFTFAEAEDLCQMLITLGRAIPPEQWVSGLVRQERQEGTLKSLGGFFR